MNKKPTSKIISYDFYVDELITVKAPIGTDPGAITDQALAKLAYHAVRRDLKLEFNGGNRYANKWDNTVKQVKAICNAHSEFHSIKWLFGPNKYTEHFNPKEDTIAGCTRLILELEKTFPFLLQEANEYDVNEHKRYRWKV
jgi:hypothetical protein